MQKHTPDQTALEERILAFVARPGYQPVKPRVIAQKLGVTKEQAMELKQAIKRLVQRGRLAYGASHLVRPADAAPTQAKQAKAPANLLVGVFRRNEKGFGFVRLSASAGAKTPMADVFIPAQRAGNASTGDLVQIRVLKDRAPSRGQPPEPDRGPRGEIVEILQRQTHRFVGTYFAAEGTGFVQVDGPLFSAPVAVGDPGAKGVRDDDKVVIEMVRFPSQYNQGEGVIVEVLGAAGQPRVDTLSVIREFELPDEFADDALAQAHQQADSFDGSVPKGRTDLSGTTIITIDPADARDFDDAISLERIERGHWRLGVHIADVAHFVPSGTPLDREALRRGTSVYLPDRVIPMLPEVISNSLASLQPGKPRFTKTAFIEFTPEGQPVATDFCDSVIASAKRLNYEQVDEFLADPAPWRRKLGAKVHDLLGRMHELAMILRRRRFERGALDITMPEVKIDLDRDGRVSGAHVVSYTESHQIIEEFMLAANEAVAQRLASQGLAFLRRIHATPSEEKMKLLTEFVTGLGFKTDSLRDRFALQKILRQAAGRPERHAVNFAVLRSMQQAIYAPQDEGHYALASECYCHFTSPIRRYPDLTVHRLLGALLAGKKPVQNMAELVVLGEHCSDRERRAEKAERELVKLKLLGYLSDRIGQEMDGVVTGVERFGLFVQGIELPAEGLVHVDSLVDDHYTFDRASRTLSGFRRGNAFRLGDRLRVAVARVDLPRRELDFRLVGAGARGRATKPVSKKPVSKKPAVPAKPSKPRRAPTKKGRRR
ncbi:MAG: ribonuclease R [Pirellulales bacterium]|nr:ribonuclease R [Pirellulales bacterium]